MFYFILAAVVFVALFLIFRDDHDRRYDQRSGSERQYLAEKQAQAQASPQVEQSCVHSLMVVFSAFRI